ncbi:MAG: sigma-54-dependent Fis family transcriptional regulator [Candidatus Riflebacteria bacterium HGW-Riflebacteria-1]|jgi:transcriptional regulator with PAS, ATPase and Fis domain|nr:MAG: sigma-54-dependent Fis family transcriptional regulator [Candidatus Riflebacteria bacterium HGW-Riflebacteria-1]
MTDTVKQPMLLLPPSRNLVIRLAGDRLLIDDVPDWLADYTGRPAANIVGKSAESFLEPFLPGLSELVRQTSQQRHNFYGFKASLTDKNGESHQLLLDALLPADNGDQELITILMQEVADKLPAALEKATFFGLVGSSEPMQRVFNKIKMYAASDAAVLITGETGAGKEGVAAAIHQMSNRAARPFVTMNCSAITETLFESELFGHEKGSFTGAMRSHRGRFERANGGTLFLDEIGDLPALSQAKLLRVLETSQIEKVGSETPIKIDVRVIAATNHNLEKSSQSSGFRADLYYRINALQIIVPPLRQRADDIELLIQHFIKNLNRKYNRSVSCLTREAVQLLKQYQWPGNVRELRNLMERLFAENQTDVIGLRSLREWYEERMNAAQYAPGKNYSDVTILPWQQPIRLGMPDHEKSPLPATNGDKKLSEAELRKAYQMADGNITRAAELLGIHKATFYRTLKTLNLEREDLMRQAD